MAAPEINAFLTHLAVDGKVSASTQNQALAAVVFLYRHVIGREVGELAGLVRARRRHKLPVVPPSRRFARCSSRPRASSCSS